MQDRSKRRRVSKGNKAAHLNVQAERARKLAFECGSPLIAELFEIHAALCERNARTRQQKRRGTGPL
jgi:hypothetical protein